jgi:ketohexokinase
VLQQLTAHSADASLDLVAVLPASASVASQQIKSALEPRVKLAHCIYREDFTEPASSYIIKSQSSGSRTIVNYNELPEMSVGEFTKIADDLGPRSSWFHFEVCLLSVASLPLLTCQGRIPDVILACIRYLRQKFPGVRVSVEAEKPARPGLQELAMEADAVFYSKSWAQVCPCLSQPIVIVLRNQAQGYQSAADCLRKQSELTHKAYALSLHKA